MQTSPQSSLEIFIKPVRNLISFRSRPLLLPAQATIKLLSVSTDLPVLNVSYKWNPTISDLLWLASFNLMFARLIAARILLLLSNIPLYGYTIFYLFIHQLIDSFGVCLFVCFLGWHMEVPWLGVKWEPCCRPMPPSHQCWIQATSATYITAHGNIGFLTHWARPGIKLVSSWVLIWFISTEPQENTRDIVSVDIVFSHQWCPDFLWQMSSPSTIGKQSRGQEDRDRGAMPGVYTKA